MPYGWTAARTLLRAAVVVGACGGAVPLFAAEVDPDTVPRAVGGASTVGGDAATLVIPYAQPAIPEGAAHARASRKAGPPDLSGIFLHAARPFQNPAVSMGVGPGLSTAPTALTLHPEEATDRLGSRGDYNTPLLRPWAAELVKQLGDNEKAKNPYYELCLNNRGVLLAWSLGNRGVQVAQTPERIYLFFGRDIVRVIRLNAKHPADLKPSINGDSVGHWEGDKLVVDTIGFDGTVQGDRYGSPTSEEMHLVERIALRQGGQVLEVDLWVDDPVVYTQPWRSAVSYARGNTLGAESVCREQRMFKRSILRGV